MSVTGRTGASASTPKSIMFGAGTIHKGLKYSGSAWNFDATIVGATNGGSKVTITPETTTVDVDGVYVAEKEFTLKTGETATMEINFAELTKDLMTAATLGEAGTSDDSNYDLLEAKADLATGSFWENVAFVGETVKGEKIIFILDNALCTSGLEVEGKNKESATATLTFTCYNSVATSTDVLPWHIYTPKATA